MLCACFSRACGRGGVWFARFLVVFRAVWCGCPLPFSAVVVGGLSVVVLVVVWFGCGGVGKRAGVCVRVLAE